MIFLKSKGYIKTCYNSLGDYVIIVVGDKFDGSEDFSGHIDHFFNYLHLRSRMIKIVYFHGDFGETYTKTGSIPDVKREIMEIMST